MGQPADEITLFIQIGVFLLFFLIALEEIDIHNIFFGSDPLTVLSDDEKQVVGRVMRKDTLKYISKM